MNAILQAYIPEQSQATTVDPETREPHNSQANGRREESNQEEGSGERLEEREAILENPPQTKAKKMMKAMILKLE